MLKNDNFQSLFDELNQKLTETENNFLNTKEQNLQLSTKIS